MQTAKEKLASREREEVLGALHTLNTMLGSSHQDTQKALLALARLDLESGTEETVLSALSVFHKVSGPDDEETVTALQKLAALDLQSRDISRMLRAVSTLQQLQGPEEELTKAQQALLSQLQEEVKSEDREHLLSTLGTLHQHLGPDDENTKAALLRLADLDLASGEKDKMESALNVFVQVLGPEHATTREAREKMEKVAASATATPAAGAQADGGSTQQSDALQVLAAVATASKSREEVLEALATLHQKLGPEHPYTRSALLAVAGLDLESGQEEKVLNALSVFHQVHGPQHPQTVQALETLARLDANSHDIARMHRAVGTLQQLHGQQHPETQKAQEALQKASEELERRWQEAKELQEAEKLFSAMVKSYEAVFGPDHPLIAAALQKFAEVLIRHGDYNRAQERLGSASQIWVSCGMEHHPDTLRGQFLLAFVCAKLGDRSTAELCLDLEDPAWKEHPDYKAAESLLAGDRHGLATVAVK